MESISKRIVIPAKAGIQSKYVVCSTHYFFILSASHIVFHWIPAFAGMTNKNVGIPQP
jgi:hypothetical protein